MKKTWIIGGVVLAAVAGGGAWWASAKARDATIPPEAIATAHRGDLEIVVTETGRIQPLTKVDVKSKVAGQVHDLKVKEGQRVKRGDVLLELDPTDFKRNLAQAEADRAMVRSELDALVAGSRREDIAEARAMLAQSRTRAKRAAAERARANQAHAAGSLTPREWEQALSTADEAQDEVRGAESKLARLLAGARPEEVAQARARLRKADVAYQAAKDQLAYSVIRAPIDGTVIHTGIEIGEMVTPGVSETGNREPLLTVADLSKLVVESDINQIDVGKVSVDQVVAIRVDTLPGKKFTGRVHKVAPAAVANPAQKEVQLFPIDVLVAPGAKEVGLLKPGMRADIDIFVQRKPDVVLLPIEAVVRGKDAAAKVTVLKKQGNGTEWSREPRDVQLGSSDDDQIEVISGLSEGDQVYIDPASAKANTNQF